MDSDPYTTSDTPLAAYLQMRGMTCMGTMQDKNDSRRRVFIFIDEPERPKYEQQFRDDEGGFWSYWCAIKIVQRKLNDKVYGE